MSDKPTRPSGSIETRLRDAALRRRRALRAALSYIRAEVRLARLLNERARRAQSPEAREHSLASSRAVRGRIEAAITRLPLTEKRRRALERELAALASSSSSSGDESASE